jgi:hypothetical protein
MARSTNIYVVLSEANINLGTTARPLAAFTVKHELASWLDKRGWDYDWRIYRIPDGGLGEPVRLRCPQDTHNTGKYNGTYSPTTR